MVATAVLLVQDASPSSITAFHDLISNEIPKVLGRWSFELRIFKSNTQLAGDSQFLYDLSFDNEQGRSTAIMNGESLVTSTVVPQHLLQSGSSNGSVDSFDHIIQTKLQSLWLLRQTLKGENGQSYEIHSGEFVIRCCNVLLHGNFKSFIIVVEYIGRKRNGVQLIEALVSDLGFPKGKLCTGQIGENAGVAANLAFQYTEALK